MHILVVTEGCGKMGRTGKLIIDGTSQRHRQILRAIGMGNQPRENYVKVRGKLVAQPHRFDIDYPRTKGGMLCSNWEVLEVLSVRGFCREVRGHWDLTDKGRELLRSRNGRRREMQQGFTGLSPRTEHESRLIALMNQRRARGWADPVDALLDIAYETRKCSACKGSGKQMIEETEQDCEDCKGEGEVWEHDVSIRLTALQNAAPYMRPKLQAIAVKTSGSEKSHAEWLKELENGRPETMTIEGESHEALGNGSGGPGSGRLPGQPAGPADDPGRDVRRR